jgi:Transposase IS200 like
MNVNGVVNGVRFVFRFIETVRCVGRGRRISWGAVDTISNYSREIGGLVVHGHGPISTCCRTWFAHHITQWGSRRQPTFFCDEDYQYYLDLMVESCAAHSVEIWAYCLMTNHVHLIAVPQSADGLARAIGEVHRRYTRMLSFREGWRAHR